MFSSIQLPTNDGPSPSQTVNKNDRSFRMDRGKIVCNGCGGHFPNLVLFENHTHKDGSREAYMPSKKSGPKTVHKTFNNISHEEMMEAFHKMPELKGCYYKSGQYVCCMCGKGFGNPYVLFSHKIIHPNDMKPIHPKPPPSHQTQTPKMKYFCTKEQVVKVVSPTVCEYVESDDDSDISDEESEEKSSCGLPSVTKAVLKMAKDPTDHIDDALPITFGESQEMVQVPWVPVNELIKRKPGQEKGSRTYIYKMQGKKSERSTYVNIYKPKAYSNNVVMVTPNLSKKTVGKDPGEKYTTNPGTEKGLVFTDLDEDKMKKVFNTLPGLQKCKVLKDGKFQCDRCYRVCENPYLLFSHRLTHKDVMEEEKDASQSEERSGAERKLVFYSLPGLNKCKMINGEYFCDNCPEKFGNPYLLFTHKMSHDNADNRPKKNRNVIEIQEKSAFGNIFGRKGLSHCKIEKGKYFCDKCSRVFSNPYLLLNHKLIHEKKEEVKTVAMTSCSVQTEDVEDTDAQTVPQEEEEDGDEISYECNLCQVLFQTLEGLASHIEAHTKDAEETEEGMDQETETTTVISDFERKRQSTSCDPSSTEGSEPLDTAPEAKIIKKEKVTIYPGEIRSVQSESPKPPQRIKIKVELVPSTSTSSGEPEDRTVKKEVKTENSVLKIRTPAHRKPLKRAVVQLEKLDIKPNQICILK